MQTGRTSEQIKAEIERMFGFFPNFFQPVLGAPEALESLWQEALTAYVNNPLPAVFKEKLFARLSRYCATHYCLVTHSCLMRLLGQSAEEIARVLESPAPASDADIEGPLHTLASADSPLPVWPGPGSRLEEALLRCSEISFLNARGAAVNVLPARSQWQASMVMTFAVSTTWKPPTIRSLGQTQPGRPLSKIIRHIPKKSSRH
jgi:alkylhydroperoxidase family enzyme